MKASTICAVLLAGLATSNSSKLGFFEKYTTGITALTSTPDANIAYSANLACAGCIRAGNDICIDGDTLSTYCCAAGDNDCI